MDKQETILMTGAAGFIGFSVSRALLDQGYTVVGLDCLNDYYDVTLKESRNAILKTYPAYTFCQQDLTDRDSLETLFSKHSISRVCHLAAQAGVRYSLTHPFVYQKTNLEGFLNLLEAVRHHPVKNFIYASSSSVYGGNKTLPFSEAQAVDHPISLYAATKKANELIAHTYSHLYQIPTTGLRFFTVYGPWGRPDMALFLFTRAILADEEIQVFNHGKMRRSFTYIDDIVSGVLRSLATPFDYEILNLGNDRSESLMDYIGAIETSLGKTAKKKMMPLQPGDVPETTADLTKVREKLGFSPTTNIEAGIRNFIEWYREYYKV